ncbi:hypothetical protein [Caballeronia sp. ATUFL_M2_KS44]|uniref:hypothetical protein n=1 Tax=Caballeronia sp. ATUFL_M2_KS44 TaxID=2921767 RepID=UPI002028FFF7|nr:hypothetical protein [Caballeronia sp. ATUFL_M2_KS44]
MQIIESTKDFGPSVAASPAAPSIADRWQSAHWFAEVAATGDAESKSFGPVGCLGMMLSILPDAHADRAAVFHDRRGSELR